MWLIALFLRLWNWSPEWRIFPSALKHKVILKTNFRKVSNNCHQQWKFHKHLKSGAGVCLVHFLSWEFMVHLLIYFKLKSLLIMTAFLFLWFCLIFCFPVEVLHSSLSKETLIRPWVLHCCTGFNRIFLFSLSVLKSQISLHLSSSNKEVCTVDITWPRALRFAEFFQEKSICMDGGE